MVYQLSRRAGGQARRIGRQAASLRNNQRSTSPDRQRRQRRSASPRRQRSTLADRRQRRSASPRRQRSTSADRQRRQRRSASPRRQRSTSADRQRRSASPRRQWPSSPGRQAGSGSTRQAVAGRQAAGREVVAVAGAGGSSQETPAGEYSEESMHKPPDSTLDPHVEEHQDMDKYEYLKDESSDMLELLDGNGWNLRLVAKQKAELEADFAIMEKKIHRFPRSLNSFFVRYGAPVILPIGPYEDSRDFNMVGRPDFVMATMVKNVATDYFVSATAFGSCYEMFKKFCSDIGDVRRFCQRSDVQRTTDATLKFKMLRDGCFLLQYMHMCTIGPDKMPAPLVGYFESNQAVINRDIMLLENQLPWVVIKTLTGYQQNEKVPVDEFVAKMARTLQVRKGNDNEPDLGGYEPPHLLGLLRCYKIGGKNVVLVANNDQNQRSFSLTNYCCFSNSRVPTSDGTNRPMSKTISAIELAEIGIELKASKTTRFTDMGIKKGLLCTEVFLAPLLLDETRLCWLVNMAALELCTATALRTDAEGRAVCSYLVVLAMLMDREEDVHALRSKGLLQGELTNKETLDFFKDLVKHISGDSLYVGLMQEIEDYKLKRWMWIKVHKFMYRNWKKILSVLSIIGVLFGIFKGLFSLMHH